MEPNLMMIWNIVTLSFCFLTILFFRRIDRANLRIMKLKRFTDKSFKDFKQLTKEENRKFNDATIEMDILLKKADSLSTKISSSIDDLGNKLKGLDLEKANLKKVDHDLQIVSNAAQEVNEQIKYIESAKSDFNEIVKKINTLSGALLKIEKENATIINSFNEKVRQRSRELSQEITIEINKLKDSIHGKEDSIVENTKEKVQQLTQNFTNSLSKMEQNITDIGDAILENIKLKTNNVAQTVTDLEARIDASEKKVFNELYGKINHLEDVLESFEDDLRGNKNNILSETRTDIESLNNQILDLKNTFSDLENGVFSDIAKQTTALKKDMNSSIEEYKKIKHSLLTQAEDNIDRVYEKIKIIEDSVNESRTKLVSSFEEEVNKIRHSMDALSLHSISKKDEIVNAVRKEAEEVRGKIENFTEHYMQIEKDIEKKFDNLANQVTSVEQDVDIAIDKKLQKATLEFTNMEERLTHIKNEIISYEETHRVFARSDEMLKEVDRAIYYYTNIIEESKTESRELKSFMEEAEEFKEAKKMLEKELKIYSAKREKLENIETEIHTLLDLTNDVRQRAELLEENSTKIDEVNYRINTLTENYVALDHKIAELEDYEATISKNLNRINRIDDIMTAVESKVSSFQKVVERSDKKVEKLKEYLQHIEENTLILKAREQEIIDVRDKFSELDGLSAHLEKRVEQINAMLTKVEKIHSDIDKTDVRLQNMFDETDQKMRQFSDFIQSVGSPTSITKKIKNDLPLEKNINENVIKTVRELSTRGWSSNEISEKLLLEENTVRFIINTASL
jgi:chromosome segregation ATPase